MKKTIIKAIILFFLVVGLLTTGFFFIAYKANFSEGNRTGRLMKFSSRGILFKTHEGQLDVSGLTQGKSGMVSSTWEFSVDGDNATLLADIDKAMTEDRAVKLHYEEKFFRFWWRGDTKYFVTRVELLHEAK